MKNILILILVCCSLSAFSQGNKSMITLPAPKAPSVEFPCDDVVCDTGYICDGRGNCVTLDPCAGKAPCTEPIDITADLAAAGIDANDDFAVSDYIAGLGLGAGCVVGCGPHRELYRQLALMCTAIFELPRLLPSAIPRPMNGSTFCSSSFQQSLCFISRLTSRGRGKGHWAGRSSSNSMWLTSVRCQANACTRSVGRNVWKRVVAW